MQNAVAALLAEYRRAIYELQQVIADIDFDDLITVVDAETADTDCRSIQTILTHVVSAGYSYCVYIQNLQDSGIQRPLKVTRPSIAEYINELDKVFQYTCFTLANIEDDDLKEPDIAKLIKTSWGQLYDIEQMMEHAIVHILRHRRQLEKFKKILKSK